MSAKNAQTHAKWARELALKERRERKRARRAEAAAQRAAVAGTPVSEHATADSLQPETRAAGFMREGADESGPR
jgi:hypothetical protein